MDLGEPFVEGIWVIEDGNHEGISIQVRETGSIWYAAWAENWDDTWGWETILTREEVDALVANPENARELLKTEREWVVFTPSSVPRDNYVKVGRLSLDDGFMDSGTGGKANF